MCHWYMNGDCIKELQFSNAQLGRSIVDQPNGHFLYKQKNRPYQIGPVATHASHLPEREKGRTIMLTQERGEP